MLSDGHNLMLNSREEYRLWHILEELSKHKDEHFQGDPAVEDILCKWIDRMLECIETARKQPYETIDM